MAANSSVLIIGVNLLFVLLSTATAATRLQRTISKIRTLQAHDFMLVAALICGIAEAVLQCIETKYGLGAVNGSVQAGAEVIYTEIHLALMVTYFACNMFVKLSLLLFYRALSRDGKYFYVLCFMGGVAILFGLSSIITVIFQCQPVPKLWTPALEGHCINVETFYYANGAFMIANDIVLYILPILIVREVQLSKAKAAAMNVLFALGFIVVVASCMRLVAVHSLFTQPDNSLYYDAMLLIWCTIENHLAIIIICLPAVKAAIVSFAPSLKSMPSSFWSNVIAKRKSSVPAGGLGGAGNVDIDGSDVPRTPSTVKRGSSWFSFGASTIKSKGSVLSASGSRGSMFKPSMQRLSSDEVQLQKLPSVSVVEEGPNEGRESRDQDERSFVSRGQSGWTAFPRDEV